MSEEDVKKKPKEVKPDLGKLFVERVLDRVSLWKNTKGDPYGDFPHLGEKITWHLESKEAKAWYWTEWYTMFNGLTPSFQTILPAIEQIKSQAIMSAQEFDPQIRVKKEEQTIHIDLSNKGLMCKIDPTGWFVKPKNGIKFLKGTGQQALVIPEPNGDIHLLRKHLPTITDTEYKLILSWLIGAYTADDGFPVLVITGSAGSAKSSVTWMLKQLVDPNDSGSSAPPNNAGDLEAMVKKSYVVYIDNISTVPGWLSDYLCRLTAGESSIGGRKLYTNADDASFKAKRPVLLNGIPQFVERADLMDRTISVELPPIPETEKRAWNEVKKAFENDLPKILGGLYTVIAGAMKDYHSVKPTRLPRLAGFGRVMWAAESHLGWTPGEFQRIWDSNTQEKSQEIIGSSPVAQALDAIFAQLKEAKGDLVIRGNAAQVLNRMTLIAENPAKLPKHAKELVATMRNLSPALVSSGITWYKNDKRSKDGYVWEIRKAE